MNITRIAVFTGLLIAGLITGLFWRSASADPAPSDRGHAMGHSTDRPDTPAATKQEPSSDPTAPAHPETGDGHPQVEAASAAHDIENSSCPIMGNPTDADSFAITYNGLRVRFCCPGCDGKFLERPRALLTALKREGANVPDTALEEEANPEVIDLENTVCPVMKEPVGDSGLYVVHRGLKIRLCCESCLGKFDDRTDAIMKALQGTDPRVAARVGS